MTQYSPFVESSGDSLRILALPRQLTGALLALFCGIPKKGAPKTDSNAKAGIIATSFGKADKGGTITVPLLQLVELLPQGDFGTFGKVAKICKVSGDTQLASPEKPLARHSASGLHRLPRLALHVLYIDCHVCDAMYFSNPFSFGRVRDFTHGLPLGYVQNG